MPTETGENYGKPTAKTTLTDLDTIKHEISEFKAATKMAKEKDLIWIMCVYLFADTPMWTDIIQRIP